MRRLLIAAACLLSLAPTTTSAPAAQLTQCRGPEFRGVDHRYHALRKVSLQVGERVGTAVFQRVRPLECTPVERPVLRLRGIAVGRAVSVDGGPRALLIRGDLCIRAGYDTALVRCLKRGAG